MTAEKNKRTYQKIVNHRVEDVLASTSMALILKNSTKVKRGMQDYHQAREMMVEAKFLEDEITRYDNRFKNLC